MGNRPLRRSYRALRQRDLDRFAPDRSEKLLRSHDKIIQARV